MAWSKQHSLVAVALVAATAAGVATTFDDPGRRAIALVALCVAAVGALLLDAWGGFLVGLAAASGLIVVRRAAGMWDHSDLWPALVEVAATMAIGVLAGATGQQIRRSTTAERAIRSTDFGVFGSLGLISEEMASARLEEEVARATTFERSLGLLLGDVVVDADVPAESVGPLRRAAVRQFEACLRDTDVPFAVGISRIGAILPETGDPECGIAAARVMDAISAASMIDRVDDDLRAVIDRVHVRFLAVAQSERTPTAAAMLDALVRRLDEHAADAP